MIIAITIIIIITLIAMPIICGDHIDNNHNGNGDQNHMKVCK